MKKTIYIVLFFSVLNCFGQDSVFSTKKHYWSYMVSANLIVPTVHEYKELRGPTFFGYDEFTINPLFSISPYFQVQYKHILNNKSHVLFFISPIVAYKQSSYKSEENGKVLLELYYIDVDISKRIIKNYAELAFSFEGELKIGKKCLWSNELLLGTDFLFYEKSKEERTNASNTSPYITNSSSWQSTFDNVLLSYKLGIIFNINDKISLSPSIHFPLLYFNKLLGKNDDLYLTHYTNISIGMSLGLTKQNNK